MEKTYKKRQTRGPRGMISAVAKALIIKNELTDKEMCTVIKERFPEANTSVKAIQYYRHALRTEGKIPPAKINRRKDKIRLMWELIPGPCAVYTQDLFGTKNEPLEGQYTGKALILRCREVAISKFCWSKCYAYDHLYSVPSCALFLHELGWECVEFQVSVKCAEYIGDES